MKRWGRGVMLGVLLVVLMIVTYIPQTVTFLPNLVG